MPGTSINMINLHVILIIGIMKEKILMSDHKLLCRYVFNVRTIRHYAGI